MLRIFFVLLAVASWGTLAWLTMLRIALLLRRGVDWLLFVVCCLVTMGLFVTVGFWGSDPDSTEGNTVDLLTGLGLLTVALTVAVYYLVVDARFQAERQRGPSAQPYQGGPAAGPGYGFGPPPQGPAAPGYGYPPQRPGYGYPPVNPASPVNPAHPVNPVPPAPAGPAPRIDQVRAELDELSDYLRKDRREQNP
ncbi:hypothetical protein ACFYXL_30400 [Streptomyces tsukubensis]|uniref:hypothetical protein n=1 Tax=Streptomyces tsukubensis TaxID=83656 RepID=UPI00367869A2